MKEYRFDATDDEQQLDELIQLILSGEVEGATIIGYSTDGKLLDPLTNYSV